MSTIKTIHAKVIYPVSLKLKVHEDLLLEENSEALRKMILDEAELILQTSSIEPEWDFEEEE